MSVAAPTEAENALAASPEAQSGLAALPLADRMALHFLVEQFLFHEAWLLDQRRYREWLALIAEDIHYWMPIRRTVAVRDIDREFTRVGDMAYFDDDRRDLAMRVDKLYTGSSWSEDPPSRTRHFVGNVQIVDLEGDLVSVRSSLHLYRSRLEGVTDSFCARREDRLRRAGESFRLQRRHIYLDHTVIHATNLSTLF
ncbi:MAG: aromatic-ring-hydroxylating dioxygenase subunit beta [Reyranellaceae bacterium]